MAISWNEIRTRASTFVNEWKDKAPTAREEADAQTFENEFFTIFGVSRNKVALFENKVELKDGYDDTPDLFGEKLKSSSGYIDLLWPGYILIEMKSPGKDLIKAYEQARAYANSLSQKKLPKVILICDFNNFDYYDLEDNNKKHSFTLTEFVDYIELFGFLAGYKDVEFQKLDPVNIEAAERMGELHDTLKNIGYSGHQLEMYLVRLLFCLFADDTGIFEHDHFINYINHRTNPDGSDLALHIEKIFETLNRHPEKRLKTLDEQLNKFPYVNGGLFEERLDSADFDSKMRDILIRCCTLDWSKISPAIFGAMFQSVKNKEARRTLGEHYTSEENILKLIKPLFLDDLWEEFNKIKKLVSETKKHRLLEFHTKIIELKFLDPACGCGNFLVISYRELRKLEIEVIKEILDGQYELNLELMVRVNVNQFYGIEIEEFPARIAQTAMWLIDHLMNMEVSSLFDKYYVRIPLTAQATIINGNALTIDWETIIPKNELTYILGNPPFIGHQYRNEEQIADMENVFVNDSKAGKLDYVCCWYKKSAEYIRGTKIITAFVSTNSIVQGESVAIMSRLYSEANIEIVFAYLPFVWNNEARGKASVHCVIIGFSCKGVVKEKYLFSDKFQSKVSNINGYLFDAPNVFIQARGKPLQKNFPEMSKGSQPTDGGNLIFSQNEYDIMISEFPQSKKFFRQYVSGEDFINNKIRYCLWLKGVAPTEYRSIKPIESRLKKVAECRLNSPTASVRRDAETPMLFTQIRHPETRFLAVPVVSSERRRYIPIGYLEPSIIASDQIYIVPNATLFLFGVLTSNIHMAWMKVICGRLKSDYRYSPAIYNNFPFPEEKDKFKKEIEENAQSVLNSRLLFSNSSLADLYDPLTMPPELLKAHHKLDKSVEKAYGRSFDDDTQRVAYLFELYQKMTGELFVDTKKKGKGRKI